MTDEPIEADPIPVGFESEEKMPVDLPENVTSLSMQRMQAAANTAHENFVTHQNVITYDHLEQKRMVTLDEALGAREVQAKQSPGGPGPA